MTISRINFTSGNSVLASMYNNVQPINTTPTSAQGVENVEIANADSNSEKSHKVRNWTIGLSAAAVLTALGVVAGKGGYLGERVQRFLGAAKKETYEVLNKSDIDNVDDIVDGIMRDMERDVKCSGIVEPQAVVDSVGNKADDAVSSVVESSGKRLASKLPENFDPDAINAKLDLTIPKITEPWHIDKIPDPFEGVDPELLKAGKDVVVRLPNGHSRDLLFCKGKFMCASEYSDTGKKIYSWMPKFTTVCEDGREFSYDSVGNLSVIWEKGKDGLYRYITLDPSQKNVKLIWHLRRAESGQSIDIKKDFFKNGERIKEEFYDQNVKNVIFSRDLK